MSIDMDELPTGEDSLCDNCREARAVVGISVGDEPPLIEFVLCDSCFTVLRDEADVFDFIGK